MANEIVSSGGKRLTLAVRRAAPTHKRGRPSKATRAPYTLEHVVDAAVRVFNRRGYEASSMLDVAREAGLTKSSLYHYVSGKEALLAHALQRAFSPLFAALEQARVKGGSPLSRLRYIIEQAVLVTLEFAAEVELLQRVKGNSETERQALQWRQRVDREMRTLLEQAHEVGQLRPELSPALLTRLIFGLSNSLTQWYQPAGKLAPNEVAGTVVMVVMRGIERRAG